MKRFLVVCLAALALPASALAWGGVYPTGDSLGTSVNVQVSDSYPVDNTLPQTWSTYLGTLVHGPEMSKLTLRLAPQWAPPADLRPAVVATRSPIPFICP